MEAVNPVLESLKVRYYAAWLAAPEELTEDKYPHAWSLIYARLEVLKEFKEELRRMINSGDIDNA